MKITATIAITICAFTATAQTGIGTIAPDPSAILDLTTTKLGFLPPRMTAAQKTAIALPKAGLIIYQKDVDSGLYYFTGNGWVQLVTADTSLRSGWLLGGNKNTNPANQFIGTTDLQPLKFRAYNLPAGEINVLTSNTAYGTNTLAYNPTGQSNSAYGFASLSNLTSGSSNTASGIYSLALTTSGGQNTATGNYSMLNNTQGYFNTAAGSYSLQNNTLGYSNVAMGTKALQGNTTGSSNVAVGAAALLGNTTISNLVAIGDSALLNNGIGALPPFEGQFNTAVGSKVLMNNTRGSYNTGIGYYSLSSNVTGQGNCALGPFVLLNNVSGGANVGIGRGALQANYSGGANIAIGESAISSNTSGFFNVAVGYDALPLNTDGASNTAIGRHSLITNTSGSNNIGIGDGADVASSSLNNAVAIGTSAQVSCSYCMVLGSINGVNNAFGTTKVGIGLTNPGYPLTLNATGNGIVHDDATTGVKLGTYTSAAGAWLKTYSNHSLLLAVNNGSPQLTVSTNGNVGIGLTDPSITEKLQVDGGNMKIGNSVWLSTNNDRLLKFGDADFVSIGEAGLDDRMQLTASQFVFRKAVSGVPSVGINTTGALTERLEVNGNIKMTDGNQGAGKLLTSDAAGKGTWQKPVSQNTGFAAATTSADVLLPYNTLVLLPFSVNGATGCYDDGSPAPNFSNANNRFTAPAAGVYHFDAKIVMTGSNANFDDYVAAYVFTNGVSETAYQYQAGAGDYLNETFSFSWTTRLSQNDVVQIKMLQRALNTPGYTVQVIAASRWQGYRIY